MTTDDLDARLTAAADRLAGIGQRLMAHEPWPLADRFDHAPEASWGPPEILAHMEEMLPYWLGEVDRIVSADSSPAAFGRVATDEARLRTIERDRTLQIDELLARVSAGIDRWHRRWPALTLPERERIGLHPTLGEMRVVDVANRMVANHLDDHLDQLEASLSDQTTAG